MGIPHPFFHVMQKVILLSILLFGTFDYVGL
jgi:hypothetical protein